MPRAYSACLLITVAALWLHGNPVRAQSTPTAADKQILDALKAKRTMRCPRSMTHCQLDQSGHLIEISFASNSDDVDPAAKTKLLALKSDIAKAVQQAKLRIVAHADAYGSRAYNVALSQRRGHAIKRFLMKQLDLPETAFIVTGLGEEQPKAGTTPYNGENRRAYLLR